jgi:hypothetical protein
MSFASPALSISPLTSVASGFRAAPRLRSISVSEILWIGAILGYDGGSKELIAAMAAVQSHSTTNPSSISQAAAIAAPAAAKELS